MSLVGSLNILGNPNNFIKDVKDGLQEMIYLTRHDGGVGLLKGTKYFLQNTLSSTFGSLNKFSRAIGDGLSSLSVD